jgi:hypothetical protein
MSKTNKKLSLFQWVLIVAVALIVLSLGTSIVVSVVSQNPAMQMTLFQTGIDGWKMGVAAILGLIGGRNAPPDK